MFEIKKIYSQSLANYLAIITAIIAFIFGLINFFLEIFGAPVYMKVAWQDQLISWFISVIVFYVIAWISGYLFSVIYNFLALRGRGIVLDVKPIDLSKIKEKTPEKQENKKDNFIV